MSLSETEGGGAGEDNCMKAFASFCKSFVERGAGEEEEGIEVEGGREEEEGEGEEAREEKAFARICKSTDDGDCGGEVTA